MTALCRNGKWKACPLRLSLNTLSDLEVAVDEGSVEYVAK